MRLEAKMKDLRDCREETCFTPLQGACKLRSAVWVESSRKGRVYHYASFTPPDWQKQTLGNTTYFRLVSPPVSAVTENINSELLNNSLSTLERLLSLNWKYKKPKKLINLYLQNSMRLCLQNENFGPLYLFYSFFRQGKRMVIVKNHLFIKQS